MNSATSTNGIIFFQPLRGVALSFEDEAELLKPFQEKAEKGQLVEVSEIKARYEQEVGHTIGGSQIYYVLRRHGWRKVMPRSRRPKKASEEVIETS